VCIAAVWDFLLGSPAVMKDMKAEQDAEIEGGNRD
jgi:hypothetical protein